MRGQKWRNEFFGCRFGFWRPFPYPFPKGMGARSLPLGEGLGKASLGYKEGLVCQDFSHRGAFWRRFFASVALRATEGSKMAYF